MDFGVILQNTLTALLNAEALYLALAAIGLNIHFGYTGLLNFGQVGFLTVAAYGLGVGVTYLDLPFFAAIALGLGMAVLLALLLGIPTLRLRADYLAIVTIASSEVLRLIARSAALRDVTGGSSGLTGFANGFYDLNPLPEGRYGIGPIDYNEARAWLWAACWSSCSCAAPGAACSRRSARTRTPSAAWARTSSATRCSRSSWVVCSARSAASSSPSPTARSSRTTTAPC
jgi:neutral amino acid transport system permease protein